MSFHVGDTVTVKREITRVVRWEKDFMQESKLYGYMLKAIREVYAKEGDKGTILEIFKNDHGSSSEALYAKVQIGDKIKTLRLTSIERVL